MAIPTLTLDNSFSTRQSTKYATIKTPLGDNYQCISNTGMYSDLDEYEVSKTDLTASELQTLLSTLKSYAGLVDFYWTPNVNEVVRIFRATEWETILTSPNRWTIRSNFKENKSSTQT